MVKRQGGTTYSDASRRAMMTVVGQPQVVYTYDNANRLTTITQGTSTVTIGYDDADRRTSVTYPNKKRGKRGHSAFLDQPCLLC